jgi:hypothetical protein
MVSFPSRWRAAAERCAARANTMVAPEHHLLDDTELEVANRSARG